VTRPLECCVQCGALTDRAGAGDGSLYLNDDGPYCEGCYYDTLITKYEEALVRIGHLGQVLTEALEMLDRAEKRHIAELVELARLRAGRSLAMLEGGL